MKNASGFPYDLAFDRNLGLLTEFEQLALRAKRIAIAGLGGVGGSHLLTLARLGIGGFTIADFDQFEYANFNRQVGAQVDTVGRDKALVLEEMAFAINPQLRITRHAGKVTAASVDDFLRDADLFVDGLDFFEIEIRRVVFARCAELGIPAVTAGPIGMGVAFIAFDPKGMSFDQYFRLKDRPEAEQYLRFLLGLSPRLLASGYLVDPARVDLINRRGPSSVAACQLCAGVTAVAAIKLLLGRGDLKPAPYNHQFDPYSGRFHVSWLPFGNAGPIQQLKLILARRQVARIKSLSASPAASENARSAVEEILNLARWAPSGDNRQPWKFTILDAETVSVTITHEAASVYEYNDGEPTWLSAGFLVETARVAATAWQRVMTWELSPDLPATIVLRFARSKVEIDPLTSFLTLRSVDRRPYRLRGLTAAEKSTLHACLGNSLILDWHESVQRRWRIARLSGAATSIRLRCPEAFPAHKRSIDWDNALSPTGIPARAIGFSRLALPSVRWAMGNWRRAHWVNRLDRTSTALLQLDLLPGIRSAGYFVLRRRSNTAGLSATPAELIEMGAQIQRFWLLAVRMGLAIQPILATVAFARYGERQLPFSSAHGLPRRAEHLAKSFREVIGYPTDDVVFIGRIGEPFPRLPGHRSVRRPLKDLMSTGEQCH